MKDYTIYTEQQFINKTVELWNQIVKPKFPEQECVKIIINKRLTSTYGRAHYKRCRSKRIPGHLDFSSQLLDGRYTTDAVENVIKHEILHHFACLIYEESCSHDYRWLDLAEEYGVIPKSHWDCDKSSIYYDVMKSKYKYKVYCVSCDNEWFYKKENRSVKYVDAYKCGCGGKLKVETLK